MSRLSQNSRSFAFKELEINLDTKELVSIINSDSEFSFPTAIGDAIIIKKDVSGNIKRYYVYGLIKDDILLYPKTIQKLLLKLDDEQLLKCLASTTKNGEFESIYFYHDCKKDSDLESISIARYSKMNKYGESMYEDYFYQINKIKDFYLLYPQHKELISYYENEEKMKLDCILIGKKKNAANTIFIDFRIR